MPTDKMTQVIKIDACVSVYDVTVDATSTSDDTTTTTT